MSKTPESEVPLNRSLYEEYRAKFPEIPSQDLRQILQKYVSDPELCQKMLIMESTKYLYGSSPTPNKSSKYGNQKMDISPPVILPRCNSSGSAGSGQSSGRSTPVNNLPHITSLTSPQHLPTLPPGTVCINGNYYQPVPYGSSQVSKASDVPLSANYGNENLMTPSSRQPISRDELSQTSLSEKNTANANYVNACYSQQLKRYMRLKKEYEAEKERLEIIIKEVSDCDEALYHRRYVVEPNPTDEQVASLMRENEKLKGYIDEISKNIDRLDNGQAFLPPPDPRSHSVHRISSSNTRVQDIFDRSNSVPCPQASIHTPPLSRPLSEQRDLQCSLNRDDVPLQIQDSSIQDWNLINTVVSEPLSIENETQWSCSRCTFLNHESLTKCEMCECDRLY